MSIENQELTKAELVQDNKLIELKPAKTKEKTLNTRQGMFCKCVSEGLDHSKSYAMAYNVKYEGNEDRCRLRAAGIWSKSKAILIPEIERLSKIRVQTIVKNVPEQMAKMLPKALDVYDDLMNNGLKESVKAQIATRVIDQYLPKVSRHVTMKVNVPADEYKRRMKLLSE